MTYSRIGSVGVRSWQQAGELGSSGTASGEAATEEGEGATCGSGCSICRCCCSLSPLSARSRPPSSLLSLSHASRMLRCTLGSALMARTTCQQAHRQPLVSSQEQRCPIQHGMTTP